MAMSKPTIVVGPRDADGYITHDYNGMIVDYCDTAGLGAAIKLLYYDTPCRDRLGRNAFESVSKLTTDAFFKSIYDIAQELVGLSKK
jgi:hypothetical protein